MRSRHRFTILGILCCAYMLCYMDRMVMASAIPFVAKDFHLSPLGMGEVLSAFFVGYALMQIPGGLLADHFGPRAVLVGAITWWSIMTALTGAAPGLMALLAFRLLFGLGEGPFPSAGSKALSIWFPPGEIARAYGLQLAATGVGAAVAPLFVAALIIAWGWRWVYFLLFVPGILLALVMWVYVRNSATECLHATTVEAPELGPPAAEKISITTSFLESLRTPSVLWCAASFFIGNLVSWGLLNWLPTYLLQAREFSVATMGTAAALINIVGVVGSVLGGYICDKYFRGRLRIPIILGFLASAGFTYLTAAASSGTLATVYLVLLYLFSTISGPAIFALPILIVPKHAVGGAFGIVNTAGQLAGVVSPMLIGYVLNFTHGNFFIVLCFMASLSLLAIVPALGIRQSTALRAAA